MEDSGQLHAPAAVPLVESAPGAHWIRGWVGPRVGLDDVKRRQILSNNRPSDNNNNNSIIENIYSVNDTALLNNIMIYSGMYNSQF
jgi:hypothetical protein